MYTHVSALSKITMLKLHFIFFEHTYYLPYSKFWQERSCACTPPPHAHIDADAAPDPDTHIGYVFFNKKLQFFIKPILQKLDCFKYMIRCSIVVNNLILHSIVYQYTRFGRTTITQYLFKKKKILTTREFRIFLNGCIDENIFES